MKDLITTMAAIMILMVFVLQFANNQIICSRIAMADKVIGNFRSSSEIENLRLKLADCFDCEPSQVTLEEEEETININLPIEGAIACGDFLGIEGGDNVVLYKNKVLKE